ncbi:calcium-binding protein [Phenylobacterium sp.]|jgi:hypothetical protein|uniref:calcium-binding protein n=1 Tax=Phenylobacterium sp. TaxID=1871053 RepID=UPI002E2F1FCD|nr:calcium-binding protein [Phenylobacterium sp.]HEX2559343.1 calcium-binding protein [Phenylobacterium sp.]
MGDIIPFISRLVGRLDWSSGEKARLQQLADKLGTGSLDLEVVFGRSDQGEPWCAVTGEDQEVLVHIARIGGRFIVHHIAQDVLETGSTLWTAVERALGEAWGETPAPALAEITPFEAHTRQTHILSALVVAAVLIEAELEPFAEPAADLPLAAPLAESSPGDVPPAAAAETDAAVQARAAQEEAARPSSGAKKLVPMALYETEDAEPVRAAAPPPALPDGKPAQVETLEAIVIEADPAAEREGPAMPRLIGGDGDDEITGTRAAEVLIGGAGDDTLDGGGAPEGTWDWLHGGVGDDLMTLGSQVVAEGGPGADRFLFTSRSAGDGAQVLGRVVDFTPSQGDALVSEGVLVTATPEADILAGTAPSPGGGGPNAPLPGFRVGVDTTGDGQADGVVLLAGGEVGGFLAANVRGSAPAEAPSAEPAQRPPELDSGGFLF